MTSNGFQTQSVPKRRRLSLVKKTAFSAIVTAVFFVALEVGLAWLGVQPVSADEDSFIAFRAYRKLFEQTQAPTGTVYVTNPQKIQFFNQQQFPALKPSDGFRIFCLGGSTTYGHPYDDRMSFSAWLRESLPFADGSKSWEVINAGGISYASYRVARLLEELTEYEPDLFIIYTGHNEFLEHRTYSTVNSAPAFLRLFGRLAIRFRTYALLKSLWGPTRQRTRKTVLPTEVQPILDETVGPESYVRDDDLRKQIVTHCEFNLTRMVKKARSVGAEVIFVTPASNLRGISPFKSQHTPGLSRSDQFRSEADYAEAENLLAEGEPERALEVIKNAVQLNERHAGIQFLRGQILWELGRFSEARVAFERALSEDVCPLRAIPEVVDTVRRVARNEGVSLVDFEEDISACATHQIAGDDWFLDHVHLTVAGYHRLAEQLLEQMAEDKTVAIEPSWSDESRAAIADVIQSRMNPRERGAALRNLSKVLGWAGKLEEAGKLSDRALALAPDDPETLYQAGIVAEDRGDLPTAEARYRDAVRIAPEFLAAYLNLSVVLGRQEKLIEAAEVIELALRLQPDSVQLLANRATVAELQGDYQTAIQFLSEAVRHARGAERAEVGSRLIDMRLRASDQ